jgi:hypothetical protein
MPNATVITENHCPWCGSDDYTVTSQEQFGTLIRNGAKCHNNSCHKRFIMFYRQHITFEDVATTSPNDPYRAIIHKLGAPLLHESREEGENHG